MLRCQGHAAPRCLASALSTSSSTTTTSGSSTGSSSSSSSTLTTSQEDVVARIESALAEAVQRQSEGQLEDAAGCLERCIEAEHERGTKCLEMATVHNRLGRVRLAQGEKPQGMYAFTSASEICEAFGATTKDNPIWANTLESIALGFHALEDYKRAEALFREALQCLQNCYGEASEPVLLARKHLSRTLEAKGDVDALIGLQYEMVKQLEAMDDPLGNLAHDHAVAHYNIANLMFRSGHFETTIIMLERALEALAKLDAASELVQINLARSQELMGQALERDDQPDLASDAYKASLKCQLEVLGKDKFQSSSSVANLLCYLGRLEAQRGDTEKALTLLTQSHRMMEKINHPDPTFFPMLLHVLGTTLKRDGQLDAAQEVFVSAVAKAEEPLQLVPTLLALIHVYAEKGMAEEAFEALEAVVDVCIDGQDSETLMRMYADRVESCLHNVDRTFPSFGGDATQRIADKLAPVVQKARTP